MLIDSHCHPEDEAYADDRDAMLERALGAGVTGLVAIGGGAEPGTLDVGLRFAREHQALVGLKIWATVGVHPHEAARATEATWAELRRLAADPLVVAVGEIGLDYHYDHSSHGIQLEVFERQLALAAACCLPVSVHCRDAFDDCLAAIARQPPPAKGVFHCFAGGREEAERVLDLGWYMSFSGMLTFPKLESLRQVAAWAPVERILVETDAPYLAPVPHRGRRNEPAWVADTAATLAQVRGLDPGRIAELTAANFFRLFPRAVG